MFSHFPNNVSNFVWIFFKDLSEFGIAPKAIVTTDDFASKTKDKIREKARQLAAATAPIPGATLLDDLIAPATWEEFNFDFSDLEITALHMYSELM